MKYRSWIGMRALMLLAVAALFCGTGCKAATCESVCEDRKSCEGAVETGDCALACDAERQSNEALGCKDAYDAWIDCQGAIDVCSSDTFCTAQNAAYLKCISDACTDDPSACSG